MKIGGREIPDIFIKACEKEEYAKDLESGNIYMKEVKYYRKIDNQYRGDVLDSIAPMTGIKILNSKNENFFNKFPDLVPIMGNLDDKRPIFCTSILDDKIGYINEKGEVAFRQEYIKEMLKFGNYFTIFNGCEFMEKVYEYCRCKKINFGARKVAYYNIQKQYYLNDLLRSNKDPYFEKHLHYKWQNEWRVVLFNNKLISKTEDSYIMKIGRITTAQTISAEEFKTLTFE